MSVGGFLFAMEWWRKVKHKWPHSIELGRPRESIYATINRVGTERPGEYAFHWSDEERAFCVTRN